MPTTKLTVTTAPLSAATVSEKLAAVVKHHGAIHHHARAAADAHYNKPRPAPAAQK
jgi:hypothetical protein